MCALQEHKNALWNPIFNTKCYNELWENLELQQETDKKAQLTWAQGFFRGATAEDHRSPGALAAAVEGAHSSRSSGEKQTDPDHTAGKTKGAYEFTSSCVHLQGYLTKVNPLDPVIVDISSATRSHSEVTQQHQGAHLRQHNCKSTQAFPAPIFFSICSHPCRRQKQTSPPGAFPTPTDYTGWSRCQTALDVQLLSSHGQVDESCLASDTMPGLIVTRISGMSLWI